MNSQGMKVAALVMLVIAVALGLFVAQSYRKTTAEAEAARQQARAIEQERAQQQAAPQTLAVVAVKPLAAYRPIDRESVALVPVSVTPTAYFTNLDEVVGQTPLVDIDAGAPVTARYFSQGNVLARVIPVGHKAMSMEINDVIAVGDFVRPGDIVDVLLYLRGGSGVEKPQARVLLRAARVLAYEDRIIDRPQGLNEGQGAEARRRVRTATLAVPEDDTTRVMLGMSLGELRLALHGVRAEGEEDTTEAGLPMTAEAVAERRDQKVPDQVISIDELARIQPPPAVVRARPPAPPRPSVEIIRANDVTRVTP
jgi:pilus assembly protein CpaB